MIRASRVTVLYASGRYRADWVGGPRGGLCVTRPGKRGGVLLTGAQGAEYRDAIATALDDAERADLCRAALRP